MVGERISDTYTINCGIVHGDDEAEVLELLRAHGWPECTPEAISFCEPKAADWRPGDRFPHKPHLDTK